MSRLILPSLETDIERNVYGIQSGQFIKIGVAKSIKQRLHAMRLLNPHNPKVVFRRKMVAAFHCEKKMHEILADKAIGREWFDVTIEELRAAASIGVAYAKQVQQLRLLQMRAQIGTPETQAVDADLVSDCRDLAF